MIMRKQFLSVVGQPVEDTEAIFVNIIASRIADDVQPSRLSI